MKTIPVSLLAASLSLAGQAFAESPGGTGGGKDREGRGESLRQVWCGADADDDGRVSRAEFDAIPRLQGLPDEKRERLFARLDKDDDGFISREELERGRRDGHRERMQRIAEMDTDNSGGISLEEFKAGEVFRKLPPEKQEELFRKLDTDGDGQLTPKDRPEPPHWKHGARRMVRDLDEDGDGAVSLAEFRKSPFQKDNSPERQEKDFRKFDRNGDGRIDSADFAPADAGRKDRGRDSAE